MATSVAREMVTRSACRTRARGGASFPPLVRARSGFLEVPELLAEEPCLMLDQLSCPVASRAKTAGEMSETRRSSMELHIRRLWSKKAALRPLRIARGDGRQAAAREGLNRVCRPLPSSPHTDPHLDGLRHGYVPPPHRQTGARCRSSALAGCDAMAIGLYRRRGPRKGRLERQST